MIGDQLHKISRILVCVDGSPNSLRAAEMAGDIAKRYSARVDLLFVVGPTEHSMLGGKEVWGGEGENIGDIELNHAIEILKKAGVEVTRDVDFGHPVEKILERSRGSRPGRPGDERHERKEDGVMGECVDAGLPDVQGAGVGRPIGLSIPIGVLSKVKNDKRPPWPFPFQMSSAVLLDFDGTITIKDSSELVLRRFADERWHVYDDQMDRGEIGLEECMKLQFALVHERPETIIAYLDRNVEPRPGLSGFLRMIDKGKSDICIVSAGLDFFIEHFMRTRFGEFKIRSRTGKAVWYEGAIRFAFPSIKNPGALDFKQDFVLESRKIHDRVILIGDGSSDYNAARSSDFIYAVKGSRLAAKCSEESLPHRTFSSFSELEDDALKYLF